jgi:hypothetical protein
VRATISRYRREAAEISARKKSILGILSNVAELGASRMEETIGKASLRDAAIGTGIAVDKMLALTGQTPAVQIANIVMPSDAERAERRAIDARLDEIARRLAAAQAPREAGPHAPADHSNRRSKPEGMPCGKFIP